MASLSSFRCRSGILERAPYVISSFSSEMYVRRFSIGCAVSTAALSSLMRPDISPAIVRGIGFTTSPPDSVASVVNNPLFSRSFSTALVFGRPFDASASFPAASLYSLNASETRCLNSFCASDVSCFWRFPVENAVPPPCPRMAAASPPAAFTAFWSDATSSLDRSSTAFWNGWLTFLPSSERMAATVDLAIVDASAPEPMSCDAVCRTAFVAALRCSGDSAPAAESPSSRSTST